MFSYKNTPITLEETQELIRSFLRGDGSVYDIIPFQRHKYKSHIDFTAAQSDELVRFGNFLIDQIDATPKTYDLFHMWIELAKAMEPSKAQDFVVGIMTRVMDEASVETSQATGYRKHSIKTQQVLIKLIEKAVHENWTRVIDEMAGPDRMDLASGQGTKLAGTAVLYNKEGALDALLQHIDARWGKSELLKLAVRSNNLHMVEKLLPLSQPRKNNSIHLQCALRELSNIDRRRPSRTRLFNEEPSESEKELKRVVARAIIDCLIPFSNLSQCLRSISLRDIDVSYIVPLLPEKDIEYLLKTPHLHDNTKIAVEHSQLTRAVAAVVPNTERTEKIRRI